MTQSRSLMVRPGAQTRKPRVKCLLVDRRTALTVCHAISMAITVVLPAPVASFSASRINSGLASALDEAGQPTQKIIERRRSAKFVTPIPKPKKRKAAAQTGFVFDDGKGL